MKNPFVSPIDFLEHLLEKGGPSFSHFQRLDQAIATLAEKLECSELAPCELDIMLRRCDFLNTPDSIMGHIRQKPFGYAGDYSIIERIYLNKVDDSSPFARWDRYALNHPAAKAVRNRKEYFKNTLLNLLQQCPAQPLQLLDIASGPARDLYELYQSIGPTRIQTTCVEMDPRAIEHAIVLNCEYLKQIQFIKENIFRFETNAKYDVIWSAGLFDYFNDTDFVTILHKFRSWLNPEGEIIIGNFGPDNASRVFMEIFGDWVLEHRSHEKLLNLASKAGFDIRLAWIGEEKEGINLFLHLKK